MSEGEVEHRNAIVGQLEVLHRQLRVQSITLFETQDDNGKPIIRITASPLPTDFDFEGRKELWQASVPLVRGGVLDETVEDRGLYRWLFHRAQSFVNPAWSRSVMANPFKLWIDGVRTSDSQGSLLRAG